MRFAEQFFDAIQRQSPTAKRHEPIAIRAWDYTPGEPETRISAKGRKILVLSDADAGDANLQRMVARFCRSLADPVEVINLHDMSIRAGCQGCCHCGYDNECIYRDADDVYGIYQKIRAADVVVEAGAIRDRFLSARWKTFWDRGFFNNHVPILVGKQIAYLISGPLMQVPNLRQILEASADVGRAGLAGIVTDECGDSGQLDRLLDELARRLIEAAETG